MQVTASMHVFLIANDRKRKSFAGFLVCLLFSLAIESSLVFYLTNKYMELTYLVQIFFFLNSS